MVTDGVTGSDHVRPVHATVPGVGTGVGTGVGVAIGVAVGSAVSLASGDPATDAPGGGLTLPIGPVPRGPMINHSATLAATRTRANETTIGTLSASRRSWSGPRADCVAMAYLPGRAWRIHDGRRPCRPQSSDRSAHPQRPAPPEEEPGGPIRRATRQAGSKKASLAIPPAVR